MESRVTNLGFIEIVKGLGAKNVLTESFDRNVLTAFFFWNHVLSLVGRGWAAAWLGLGWWDSLGESVGGWGRLGAAEGHLEAAGGGGAAGGCLGRGLALGLFFCALLGSAGLWALGSGLGLELGWDLVGLKRKLVY